MRQLPAVAVRANLASSTVLGGGEGAQGAWLGLAVALPAGVPPFPAHPHPTDSQLPLSIGGGTAHCRADTRRTISTKLKLHTIGLFSLTLHTVLSEAVWYPISDPFYRLTTRTYSESQLGPRLLPVPVPVGSPPALLFLFP